MDKFNEIKSIVDNQNTINRIKILISKGEIIDSIKLLSLLKTKQDISNVTLILTENFRSLQIDFLKGIITAEDYQRRKNAIIDRTLKCVDLIKKDFELIIINGISYLKDVSTGERVELGKPGPSESTNQNFEDFLKEIMKKLKWKEIDPENLQKFRKMYDEMNSII